MDLSLLPATPPVSFEPMEGQLPALSHLQRTRDTGQLFFKFYMQKFEGINLNCCS